MLDVLPSLLAPLLVLLVFLFLFFRLGYFASREMGGRAAFVTGSVLILAVSLWQALKVSSQYYTWFVDEAYPIIEVGQFAVLAIGLLLVVSGLALYADYWQTRREDLDTRHGRMSMLENLQHDARQPYHLLELLNLSLREILGNLPLTSGAVFLANQKQRRLVLTTASGLTKEETAALEYYPMGRNVVTQALEIGDPLLTTSFEFIDRHGELMKSRFASSLVLPLTSGLEKIGVVLLFSERKNHFGRTDIRYLAPVAGWLAEKIHSARLLRELSQTRTESLARREELGELVARFTSAGLAAAASDATSAFCQALVGFLDAESVHLCGLRQGGLVVHGGSEPMTDVGENYRTALVDAIDRTRPLIINQEAAGESERGGVAVSTLVCPLSESVGHSALVLVRSGRPFSVSDRELRQIECFAGLARLVLVHNEHHRLKLSRRKGFDAILRVLKTSVESGSLDDQPSAIAEYLGAVLPVGSLCLVFRQVENGTLSFAFGLDSGREIRSDAVTIHPGEGGAADSAASGECSYSFGRHAVMAELNAYGADVRGWLTRLWGERGLPAMLVNCPILAGDIPEGVVLMALYDIDERERAEWQRLLTLAAGLYSFRLTLDLVKQQNKPSDEKAIPAQTVTESPKPRDHAHTLSRAIREVLTEAHVSGSLYMAGQRPREINLKLADSSEPSFSSDQIRRLFESAINRFSTLAEEDDVITVATYEFEGYIYLDVSRHHRNFPPVEQVAAFGRYQASDDAYRQRPGDTYLRHASEGDSFYAVDLDSMAPAYLSFKFPVRPAHRPAREEKPKQDTVRLLAVDDQPVILDLISAMGQSLGYKVTTCSTGEDARARVAMGERFDVVLVDHSLPDIQGVELIRRLKQDNPRLQAILVSGWESPVDRQRLAALGVTDVLFKPFKIEQLTEIVQTAVTKRARS